MSTCGWQHFRPHLHAILHAWCNRRNFRFYYVFLFLFYLLSNLLSFTKLLWVLTNITYVVIHTYHKRLLFVRVTILEIFLTSVPIINIRWLEFFSKFRYKWQVGQTNNLTIIHINLIWTKLIMLSDVKQKYVLLHYFNLLNIFISWLIFSVAFLNITLKKI